MLANKKTALAAAILVCNLPPGIGVSLPQGNTIKVEVSGFRSDKGQLMCSLFASADGFPKKDEKAVGHGKATISEKKASCEFAGVGPGTYAVAVFHDENSNGKLDSNFIGMPKEGVGASNDAKGRMGPPKFDAAAFKFNGGELTLKVTLHYL
jgi:uncharacterized protein (DUF2141 family)